MATIASLNVEIGANAGNALRVFDQVGNGLQELGRDASQSAAVLGGSMAGAMDKAAAAASRAATNMDRAGASFASAAKNYRAIGASISDVGENLSRYVTLPLTLLAGASVKAYGDLQALEKGFNAVYKGAGPAADEMAKLLEVAKLPGLGLKEAYEGSISLQATGMSAEEARRTLIGFGNALATVGKGKADLKGVTIALAQISAKGKVSAEEINQIAERVPQIRKIMQSAFGTADTEVLQKMGLSTEEFISKVTDELNKLPKVTGGINNAFENMSDAGFIALSKLGEALNTSFNIEGIFNTISAALNSAADSFAALNPATQTAVFIFAGLAAAAGPILLAIGGIVSALPILAAGFAAITGPIGLAAIAIGAAAVLLIANWDKVASYFQSSGLGEVFSSLGASLSGVFDGIITQVTAFANLVKPIWDGVVQIFGTNFTETLRATGTALAAAFEFLNRILKVFGEAFKGNWSGVWDAAKNVLVAAWNGMIQIVAGSTASIIRMGGGLASAFGMDGVAARINSAAASVDGLGKSFQTAYFGAKQVSDIVVPLASKNTVFGRGIQEAFGGISDSAFAATVSITNTEKKVDDFTRTPAVKKVKVQVDKVDGVDALQSQVAKGIENIKPPKLDNGGLTLEGLLGLDTARFALPQALTDGFAAAELAARAGALRVGAAMQPMSGIVIEMTGFMQQQIASAFGGIGDLFAGLTSGNITGAAGFFKGILSIVLDFVGQFGKLLVGAGIAALNFQNLLINPVGAIAAGVALIAIAGAVKGLLSKGPKGGGGGGGGSGPSISAPRPYTTPASTYQPQAIGANANSAVTFEIEGTKLVGVLRNQQYKDGR